MRRPTEGNRCQVLVISFKRVFSERNENELIVNLQLLDERISISDRNMTLVNREISESAVGVTGMGGGMFAKIGVLKRLLFI